LVENLKHFQIQSPVFEHAMGVFVKPLFRIYSISPAALWMISSVKGFSWE
jgi:hypothetical protein